MRSPPPFFFVWTCVLAKETGWLNTLLAVSYERDSREHNKGHGLSASLHLALRYRVWEKIKNAFPFARNVPARSCLK